ncbi:hypothetical protein O0L34_g11188 [Tuta absoluta]|nr:hypothetical protein O0L34_g2118 [Tuta absoluta]KAJ2949869.1 hypothetical protein O0L34_g11188 [Tuta absoluta]
MLKCLVFLILVSRVISLESWGLYSKPGCHLVGKTLNVSIPQCVPFTVKMNACRGYCESWSFPSIMMGFKRHPVTSLGQCCNIMESEEVIKTAVCIEGYRKIMFKSPLSCACDHCQKD